MSAPLSAGRPAQIVFVFSFLFDSCVKNPVCSRALILKFPIVDPGFVLQSQRHVLQEPLVFLFWLLYAARLGSGGKT